MAQIEKGEAKIQRRGLIKKSLDSKSETSDLRGHAELKNHPSQ